MAARFVTIWFRHLLTDWQIRRQPELQQTPFVFAAPVHGRMVITATSIPAEQQGIRTGMPVADAKAIVPGLQVFDEPPGKGTQLLHALGEWCIRYTPLVAVDLPDGLILDSSGCAHLWGGETGYLKEIITKLRAIGYDVRGAMADTIGTAWAVSRYGRIEPIITSGEEAAALMSLPPAALRPEPAALERLHKLGLHQIGSFIDMPGRILRRRFGPSLLSRLSQALGYEMEGIQPLFPPPPYEERLPCLEPIVTATGIEIAISNLLEKLCSRLQQEGKGLRTATLKAYRIDNRMVQATIGTNRASHHVTHLFKLFELKIPSIAPGPGIELFTLEAEKTEDAAPTQEALWTAGPGLNNPAVAELLDRLAGKIGAGNIRRYLPEEHFWPERSIKQTPSLEEKPVTHWRTDKPRPVQLLATPEPVEVAAPIPDYPPMLFRYKGELHEIRKADGPERIEREWWLDGGEHRDYYTVEDKKGQRYWLFRSGHYSGQQSQWFIHGFFA
ncbi:Y-family DNA polymerase [Chitinophaga rhizophila]|uniref:DNA polymerase Y family protein n=1 Tax=Chitinophaga rhizophila TaxID=2866212 RepID=A0ABS7GJI1_9BACT|nr:DNA polymerase Y family protein [Chitinophaga rhizophila]MBW8687862.1 DNA polymerase Y family protein [Chitinophaga rhizophila]